MACQKVIHPEIQVCLRRAGLVVLPRLGTELAQGLQRLSGAQPMDTPTSVWRQCMGSLDAVTPNWQHDKLYLQLSKQGADVSTLLLCSPQPQAANETEVSRSVSGDFSLQKLGISFIDSKYNLCLLIRL